MKKLFRIIYMAFLLGCLCSSATAKQIYFQYTDGAAWWGNDGAKIGAIFRAGMSDQDYGVYTSFFTPVAGQTNLLEATIPAEAESFVSVQFLRFSSGATVCEWSNLWNISQIIAYSPSNNLFIANAAGADWNSTTGIWSNYGNGGGNTGGNTGGGNASDGNLTVFFKRPDAWRNTPHIHIWKQQEEVTGSKVIYEINVLNYSSAGTFNAITNDLDRLSSLGIDVLWLMPIFPIGNEGRVGAYGSPYAIKDYYSVNSTYGSLSDFKNLVNAAHKKGMEVWLDIACNHTAKDHPWVRNNAVYYGYNPYSPNGWNDTYKLVYDYNGTNTALYNEMTNVLKYWVKECDIDGYRCDYATGVPVSFWKQARAEVDKIKVVTWLAESDDSRYMEAFDMDYAWGFNDKLTAFAQNRNVSELINACQELHNNAAYRGKSKMVYLTNHDLSAYNNTEFARFGQVYNPLLVLTFTIYDYPLLYMGQEIGWSVDTFTDKKAINFGVQSETASFYRYLVQKLASLKHASPALKDGSERGSLTNLNANNGQVYAYERKSGDNSVVVVLNFSGNAVSVSLGTKPAGNYTDYIDGGQRNLSGNIDLGAYGYKVFIK